MSKSWEFKQSFFTSVSRRTAWEFWSDMQNHAEMEHVKIELEGPFQTGTQGRTITSNLRQEWELNDVVPQKRFVITGRESGFELSFAWDFEDEGDARTAVADTELIYGVTPNLSLTVEVPQVLRRHTEEGTRSGLGDVLVRGKLQVWKRDRLNASEKLSLILGLKLPTGSDHGRVPLGTGSFDPVFGIAAGHESRIWYAFGTSRVNPSLGNWRALLERIRLVPHPGPHHSCT